MKPGDIILKKYSVIESIGEGAQGYVARGKQKGFRGKKVAIKELRQDVSDPMYSEHRERFLRAAGFRFNNEYVVDPIDAGDDDSGKLHMVMDYINGKSLDVLLWERGGTLPVEEAEGLLLMLAEGLMAVHDQLIVMRDLKPENIIIDKHGCPHIIDFGVAKDLRSAIIGTPKKLIGTLAFMSPEQILDPHGVNTQSDLYSLGAIAYFILCGAHVAVGSTEEELASSVLHGTPPSPKRLNPAVPDYVDAAVMRMLAKDPMQRFQTAREFGDALQARNLNAKWCPHCHGDLVDSAHYCPACGGDVCLNFAPRCLACGSAVQNEMACFHCRRPFGLEKHRLCFKNGSSSGYTVFIPEGKYEVGRGQLFPDPMVSRRHFVVDCQNGSFVIQDAGSTNHTCVNRVPAINPTIVSTNQEVMIAGYVATYEKGEDS